ncbi:MAG: hypothetical protein IJ008_04290 [Clostridia bacterium]|nr:hypothetical protein [Clostridia bacterium]
MNKLKSLKNKLIIFVLALLVPFTMAGAITSFNKAANADDGEDASYVSSHMQEITVSNKNFNSSSSTYSLSTSLTGWSGQIKDGKTTAGIINVGTSFSNYMSTYRLSLNPRASASDSKILMINSNTTYSSDYDENRQGYVSSSLSLDSNSYYSFQVSFKSDVNYKSTNIYKEIGQTTYDITNIKLEEEKSDTNNENENEVEVDDSESKNYAKVTYQSKTYYILKTDLTADTVEDGAEQTYTATTGVKYYALSTEYVPVDNNAYGKGSIYLSGLTSENEENANNYKFEMISSSDWTTLYFFVATGNESETVSLDLWLGGENNLSSTGVVFYDDVQVYKYSENMFWQNYVNYYSDLSYNKYIYDKSGNIIETQTNDCTKLIDGRTDIVDITPENANFDFEINSNPNKLNGWTFISNSGNAQILDTIVPESFNEVGYKFVGNNLSVDYDKDTKTIKKNLKSLVLYTDSKASAVGVQANKSIDIKAHGYYKIKVHTKVSSLKQGKAYITLKENNSIYSKDFGLNENNYPLASKTSTGINNNSSNIFNNNFNIVEFYVKGGNLYDTQIDLQLWLGTESEKAIGCVVFDDITVEQISYTEYSKNSENGNVLTLGKTYDEPSIKNGYFNETTESDNNFTYPLAPADWTIENKGVNATSGIINTYNNYYAEYQTKFNDGVEGYDWARFANPANVADQIYSNNLFMFYNSTKTNQTLKSPVIQLNANSYYKISFDYKVLNTVIDSDAYIKVEMYDEFDNLLFSANKISSDGKWSTYEMFINTFEGTADSYLKISFGTTNNNDQVQGIAYLDNFELTTIDQSIFDSKNQEREDIIKSIFDMEETLSGNLSTEEHENIQKSIDELNEQLNLTSVVNMSNFYLNLSTNVYGNPLIGASNTAYTSSSNSSNPYDAPIGGIVKGKELDIESNALMIQTPSVGSYSLTSNYYIEFKASTYYALTFKLKTSFVYQNENKDITKHSKYDEDKKYNYGVTFGLNKFEYATNLMYTATEDEDEYKTYTLYFFTEETVLSQLYFAFVSDDEITAGEAIVYDLHLYNSETNSDIISADIYNEAKDAQEDKDYDINSSTKYVASLSEDENEKPEEETEKTEEEDSKKSSTNFNWLIIPTLITALAIIIAVVGTVLKKIKIKKIEIKKKESYDRKSTVHRNAIRIKAEKQRNAEVKAVEQDIEVYKTQLAELEAEHKLKVVEDRKVNGSKVTKEIEKEFKSYSAKHSKIQERIDILNEKIDNIKSPEYLLSLERKIYLDQEREQKAMKAESKKEDKENKKSNKK